MKNQKHEYIGCLSLIMILSLVGGIVSLCTNLLYIIASPSLGTILALLCGVTYLLGLIFLLQYKKLGFYLYVGSCLVFVLAIICWPDLFKRDYQYSVLLGLLVFLGLMAVKSKKTRMNGYQTIGIIKSSNTVAEDVQVQIDANDKSLLRSDESTSVEDNNNFSTQSLITQDKSKRTCEEANNVKVIKEDVQQKNAGRVSTTSTTNHEHPEPHQIITSSGNPDASVKEHKKRNTWIIAVVSLVSLLVVSIVVFLTKCDSSNPDSIFNNAKSLIDNNQYEKGIAELEKIQENFIPAKALLGHLLTKSDSIPKDMIRGEELLLGAFEKNDTSAGTDLVDLYFDRGDWDATYKIAEKLASLDCIKGYRALSCLHCIDKMGGEDNKHKDYSKAEFYALKVAKKDGFCCQYLGIMYSEGGYGIEKDYEKAFYWFKHGADIGDSYSCSNLGIMFLNGNGVNQSYRKAFESFKRALSLDSTNEHALYNVGDLFYEGLYVKANKDSAKYYFQMAAKYGNQDAAVILENDF